MLITKREAGDCCSICGSEINVDEECFLCWSRTEKDGKVWFKHLFCEYKDYVEKRRLMDKEAPTLEVYIDNIRQAKQRRKKNKMLEKKRENRQ